MYLDLQFPFFNHLQHAVGVGLQLRACDDVTHQGGAHYADIFGDEARDGKRRDGAGGCRKRETLTEPEGGIIDGGSVGGLHTVPIIHDF